jgi:hypothetical protein
MKISYLLLILSLLASTIVSAEPRRVLLIDGTEIIGELLSLKNGSYTIQSQSLGTLTIAERQVASISSLGASARGTPQANIQPRVSAITSPVESAEQSFAGQQMQSIQQSLMSNSETLRSIMTLQSNPDMQAVLADPEIMAAIQRLDLESLRNNPKIKKLMQNSDIKSISGGVN